MSGDEREAEEGKGKGFVVIDRRGEDDEPETAPPEKTISAEPSAPASEVPEGAQIPELDFSTLVHSFAISALYHMGAAPPPEGEPAPPVNLTLAQQNIDILEILETKTQGNLLDEEVQLLRGVLYEVRMRFVEASKDG